MTEIKDPQAETGEQMVKLATELSPAISGLFTVMGLGMIADGQIALGCGFVIAALGLHDGMRKLPYPVDANHRELCALSGAVGSLNSIIVNDQITSLELGATTLFTAIYLLVRQYRLNNDLDRNLGRYGLSLESIEVYDRNDGSDKRNFCLHLAEAANLEDKTRRASDFLNEKHEGAFFAPAGKSLLVEVDIQAKVYGQLLMRAEAAPYQEAARTA